MNITIRHTIRHTIIMAVILMGLFLPGALLMGAEAGFAASAHDPGKVTSMTVTVTGQPLAKLEWKESTGAANGYTILRNGKAIVRISGKNVLSYVDESLKPGKTYTYKVLPHYKDSKGNMTYGKASPAKKVLDGYSYKKESDGTMTLTGFTGREDAVTTPAKIDGVKVAKIGDSCFRGNVWIKKVAVSGGVSAIEDYAFEACGSMKFVSIPETVKTIGDGAFSGCAQIRYCDLPDSVTSLGRGAFLFCSRMTSVDLPKNLKTMGAFAFAGCESMTDVTFRGNGLTEIPDRAFCLCTGLESITIPEGVTMIGKRAFSGCDVLQTCQINEPLTIGDYAFERCYELYLDAGDHKLTLGMGVFSFLDQGEPSGDAYDLDLPKDTEFGEGTFYGSRIRSISTAYTNYKVVDGVLYSGDGTVLIAYFPVVWKDGGPYQTEAAKTGVFTVPDGVTTIAPYALYGCRLKQVILPASLQTIGHNAFTMSGVDSGMVTGGAEGMVVDGTAFDNYEYPEVADDDDDSWDPWVAEDGDGDEEGIEGGDEGSDEGSGDGGGDGDGIGDGDGLEGGDGGGDGDGIGDGDGDWNAEDYYYLTTYDFSFESLANDGIFDPEKYQGYLDIHDDFLQWVEKYIEYNKDNVPMTREAMPYITMYTGEDHYRQMTSALNGDLYKTQQSILRSGDDYREMYFMIDHGLFAELSRGRMPGDLVLYSGITPERVSALAGREDKASGPITDELTTAIIGRIGGDYLEQAMMSTTADLWTAFEFSGGDYGSHTLVMIYGPKKAMDRVGSICVDEISLFSGEEEVLFNPNARYRILDVGMVKETEYRVHPDTGELLGSAETDRRTYVKLQMLDETQGDPKDVMDIRGAKVTLSAAALTYNGKVRKPLVRTVRTTGGETLTAGTDYSVKWSKKSSRNVGAYAVTVSGKGDYAGTVKVKYKILPKGTKIKNLQASGKAGKAKMAVTVKWAKQSAKMSASRITGYQIRLATDSKFTKNKKTVTVKGYKRVSKKIRGLKGGAKYYVKIRTFKTVRGVRYYSPWSAPRTITSGQ